MDALRRVALVVLISFLLVGAFFVSSRKPPEAPLDDTGTAASTPEWLRASCELPAEQITRIVRGTQQGRSPDIQYVPREPHAFGSFRVSTHSGPWDYIQRVPLVLYGPGYIRAQGDLTLEREVTLADLAPTLAELLGIDMPDAEGQALTEVLVPESERPEPPRMIVTVVWDGGGWNVLERWPDAWPNLQRLISGGTSLVDAVVGSSPSVTPAVHATMGTGAFPARHGIVDIPMRQGMRVPDSYPNKSPKFLQLPTLADLFDPRTDNRAKVGMVAERAWHLGMMGRGAFHEGGDKDIAVMSEGGEGTLVTNPEFYRLPGYVNDVPGFESDRQTVDLSDGSDDGLWMGHTIPEEHRAGAASPLWTRYQSRLLDSLWTNEGFGRDEIPDLFFTNFKEIDLVGHVYNLINAEMRSMLQHTDAVLGEMTERLDETVGRGRWVMALTADHGSGPAARSVGGWPIDEKQLQIDVALRFGMRVTELFQGQRPTGMWLRAGALEREGITVADIADYLIGYTIGDNVKEGRRLPAGYRDRANERLFSGAFPTDRIEDVSGCTERAA